MAAVSRAKLCGDAPGPSVEFVEFPRPIFWAISLSFLFFQLFPFFLFLSVHDSRLALAVLSLQIFITHNSVTAEPNPHPMRPSILSLALAGLCLSQSVLGSKHHQSHRRHHHKRGSSGKCHSSHHSGSTAGASQGGSPSSTPTASPAVVSSAGSPSSSAAASGSASDDPFQRTDYLTINGVGIGYLPDNGQTDSRSWAALFVCHLLGC